MMDTGVHHRCIHILHGMNRGIGICIEIGDLVHFDFVHGLAYLAFVLVLVVLGMLVLEGEI